VKNKKIQQINEDRLAPKAADFYDMLDSNSSDDEGIAEDYKVSPKRQKLSNSISEESNSSESGEELDVDDDSDEEMVEEMEMQQKKFSQNEKESRKKLKDLLPIKTKTGVVPRQIETSNEVIQKVAKEPVKAAVKGKEQHVVSEIKKKNILSATELFTERENEINRQKFKIGKACAGLTENPEEKVESFKTLLELVQETGADKQKNLTSVRKLAMLSTTEVFKDIVPDYKVGIVDLENQKVKKDTLNRITYENTMLKYYKKYLRELEHLVKALKPKKYTQRPSKEDIYLAETAIVCLCELIQLLVIYLNCNNLSARKKIHDTFVKIFKTDKRLDLTRHVSTICIILENNNNKNLFSLRLYATLIIS
jgi:Nucleolar complex-associated protein